MSYQILLSNGNILTQVPDGQYNDNFAGITLIGKNYPGFGTALNNDLVNIVENFASTIPPINPLIGQLWYDSITNQIKFWNGTIFKSISIITVSATAPLNASEGDEWYSTVTQQLFIFNGVTWILVGPPSAAGEGLNGFVVATTTIDGITYTYLELYVNNNLIAIVSSNNLINPGLGGFGNIRAGWNFVTTPTSGIEDSGIFNIQQLTIGDSDQGSFIIDGYNNVDMQVNQGNVLVATNSSNAALPPGTDLTGTVYVNNLVANNLVGNIAIAAPGSTGDIIFNNEDVFSAAANITTDGNSLTISGNVIIGGNLTIGPALIVEQGGIETTVLAVNSSVTITRDIFTNGVMRINNGNVLVATNTSNSALSPGETLVGRVYVNQLEANELIGNITISAPGSTGDMIYNNAGLFAAATGVTTDGSALEVNGQLTCQANILVNAGATIAGDVNLGATSVNGNLTVVQGVTIDNNLTVTQSAVVESNLTAENLFVNGPATFNNGSGGEFILPLDQGSIAGGPLLTGANGSTAWANLSLNNFFNNSISLNGYQQLPGGLLIQWGTNSGSSGTASFPTPFASTNYSITGSGQNNGGHISIVQISGVGTSSYSWNNVDNNDDSASGPFNWIAIGF